SRDNQRKVAPAIVQTADMVQGYGDVYRQGLADWHAIIDGLAKPTFDGALPLADLAGAIAEARAAAMPDPPQLPLKRVIAELRARAVPERPHPVVSSKATHNRRVAGLAPSYPESS